MAVLNNQQATLYMHVLFCYYNYHVAGINDIYDSVIDIIELHVHNSVTVQCICGRVEVTN